MPWDRKLCSVFGWGSQLGSLPQLGSRVSITAAQGLWLGLLVRQGWRLCLAAEWSHRLASLSRHVYRMGSATGTAYWLWTETQQNFILSSLARQGHRLGSIDGQSRWLESKIRRHYRQRVVKIYKLLHPLLAVPQVNPMRQYLRGFPGKLSAGWRSWVSALGPPFCPGEIIDQGLGGGDLLGVAACWPGAGEIWPKGNKCPYPFNVFFLDFCGPGVCFSFISMFWDLHKGILSVCSAGHSFYAGN